MPCRKQKLKSREGSNRDFVDGMVDAAAGGQCSCLSCRDSGRLTFHGLVVPSSFVGAPALFVCF